MKPSGKADLFFVSVIVAAHIVFFILALHFTRIYMGDSYEYVYMALNIKEQFLFYSANAALPIMLKNYTLRPPGYSLFLLLVYLFSVNNWIVIVVQNLVSIFNILYFRRTIQLIGYNKKYDWILLIFILAFPAQFIYANTIAPDLLVQTCVLIYFRHFLLLLQKAEPRHAWLMSIALTYGLFTKPILYLFVPVHFLILLWACFRFRVPRVALLALIIPIGSILLYNTWNLQRTGKFHFTSIQPWNGVYYNVRMYQEHKLGREKAGEYMQQIESEWEQTKSFKEWYDFGNSRSMEFLKTHFFSYMVFHTKQSLQFFIHPGKGEIDLFTGALTYGKFYQKTNKRILQVLKETPVAKWPSFFAKNPSVPIMFVVLFLNGLKILGAAFFFFNKNIKWWCRLFVTLLLFYFSFMTGPLANTRYHLPVSLLFIGCAVLGYQKLLQSKKNERIITQ
ncbi:MAG TPA: hypothetical protein PL009_04810 [Flavipsychrobacter sp.]|nr:hypothetical protein [Flavipsychrobacter sp.]